MSWSFLFFISFSCLFIWKNKQQEKRNRNRHTCMCHVSFFSFFLFLLFLFFFSSWSYLPVKFSVRSKTCQSSGRNYKDTIKTSYALSLKRLAWQMAENPCSVRWTRNKQWRHRHGFISEICLIDWIKKSKSRSSAANGPTEQSLRSCGHNSRTRTDFWLDNVFRREIGCHMIYDAVAVYVTYTGDVLGDWVGAEGLPRVEA